MESFGVSVFKNKDGFVPAGLAWLFWRLSFHFWAGLELDSVWAGLITDRMLRDVYLPRCVRMEARGLLKETSEGCHADIQA